MICRIQTKNNRRIQHLINSSCIAWNHEKRYQFRSIALLHNFRANLFCSSVTATSISMRLLPRPINVSSFSHSLIFFTTIRYKIKEMQLIASIFIENKILTFYISFKFWAIQLFLYFSCNDCISSLKSESKCEQTKKTDNIMKGYVLVNTPLNMLTSLIDESS